MILTELAKQFLMNLLESSNGDLNDNISEIKKQALNSFLDIGLPTKKNEDWKYTNVQFLNKIDFNIENVYFIPQKVDSIIRNILVKFPIFNYIVCFNGKFLENYSHIVDKNIEISNLTFNTEQINHLTIDRFDSLTDKNNPFTLLNTSIVKYGIIINVPKNYKTSEPLVLFNITISDETNIITSTRNLVNLSEGSSLNLIEYNFSNNLSKVLNSRVTEVKLDENAFLNLLIYQNEDNNTISITETDINQSMNSKLVSDTITLSKGYTRNDLNVRLIGEYSEARFYGLYVGKGHSFIDNHTLVEHRVPNCQSDEFYKGIIDDHSHCVFNGKIIVKPDAQKTNAYQSNKNILLTGNSTINTKPQLEIYADDVRCSHGATVGSIDKEALFYLLSRGISELRAKNLLLKAYTYDIINKIQNEKFVNIIEDDLGKLLNFEDTV